MGASGNKSPKNNSVKDDSFSDDNFSIEVEAYVKPGGNLNATNNILLIDKAKNSVCEIITDSGYGTGFFCEIKFPDTFSKIHCLITNNHVITRDMLKIKDKIELKLDKNPIKRLKTYNWI